MPGLAEKYDIEIKTISKPRQEYKTDEYNKLSLPVAPAVMIGEEIVVEGSDISLNRLEEATCRHLGLPEPRSGKIRLVGHILKR